MNTDNFDKQARAAERKVVLQATEAIRAMALELAADLVERAADRSEPGGSPVASGRYAASMRVSLDTIDSSTAPEDKNYRYPPASVHNHNPNNLPGRTRANVPISRVSALLRTFKLGQTIWFSNSVPYSRRIENARHSWQTPQGVFERTVRHVAGRFREIKIRVFRG